ncbi:MAG: glycerate kinase [Hyphomicrobiaceae bacterium]|nr:glycerate kinase [Hyphomicrobiaceae bacterium]
MPVDPGWRLDPPDSKIGQQLFRLAGVALRACDPLNCVPPLLPEPPKGRTLVLGAGKAAAAMAKAVEANWTGPLSGLVITRFGHGVATDKIEVVEAGHPVPEANGQTASRRMLELAQGLTEDDLVIFLVSGGASSLFEVPADGISLEQIRDVNRQLLASGAPIAEMNCVRKHLSQSKGGQLAKLVHPARLVTIGISDVPGDDWSTIGSGPTVPDDSTREMALDIVEHYRIDLPQTARAWLDNPRSETPKPGDPVFDRSQTLMAARPADMIAAVARAAQAEGMEVLNLGADIEGEAREIGAAMAAMALNLAAARSAKSNPLLILSGGETTVTLANTNGRGGRNTEFLLGLHVALGGHPRISGLALDTDGIDGSEDNAGAWFEPALADRIGTLGVDGEALLDRHLSHDFFARTGTLIVTGPTRTNVNDLRLILVD